MAKKRFLSAVFGMVLAAGTSGLFAQGTVNASGAETEPDKYTETWLSLGYTWAVTLDLADLVPAFGDSVDFYSGASVINLTVYSFYNRNTVGLFLNYGFMFVPVEGQDTYSPIGRGDFIAGLGFRHAFTDHSAMHFAVGPNVNLSYLKVLGGSAIKYEVGIGGDIGYKYDLIDSVFIDFGSRLAFDWARYSATDNKWQLAGVVRIQPYLAVGINLSQRSATPKLGKYKAPAAPASAYVAAPAAPATSAD